MEYSRDLGAMDVDVLLRDEAFNKHSLNDGHHVSPYDQGRIDVGFDNLVVRMVQGIDEESFKRVLSKAQRATIGIPSEPAVCRNNRCDQHEMDIWRGSGVGWERRHEDVGDWEEMLKGGLQTALESQVVVFEIIGTARASTHQVVRTRKAAFHQQSMRASFFGNEPNIRMPESVWRLGRSPDTAGYEAFLAWEAAIAQSRHAYRLACEADVSYQDARYILPIGTETYIMCEYPVREFLAVYAYRACSMFQWEIVHTVRQMGALLAEAHPWLAPYIKISCEPLQRCTFQGWEDVELGCDLPWAKHELRTFQPTTHRIRSAKVKAGYTVDGRCRGCGAAEGELHEVGCPTREM